MEHVYFFTGFPGFICNQLIRELLKRDDYFTKAYMLVLPSQKETAAYEITKIKQEMQGTIAEFVIVEGDITKEGLKIPQEMNDHFRSEVTHVFHLAAIYDLAIDEKTAQLVNVSGTNNVNDWVRGLDNLERYVYFSTAYVAGIREGKLYEQELVEPVGFKNHYEKTKYEAEVLVEEMKKEKPVTIIRPGIVKGHSATGETIKFDGPYFILNFLDRLSFLPIFPKIGRETGCVVNMVPVDYIIQATSYLALYKEGAGKTYHLTDPNPHTATEIYELFVNELYKRKPKGTLPLTVSRGLLTIKPVRSYLGIEKEALDYFTWQGVFDCTQAQTDLKGSGIVCPRFSDGVPAMVDFYLKNKKDQRYQIQIR
ncbi:SDR family oxidoreductase [Bacillus sp. V59.32b]|uniref:SDR family oxidoreductase n=1 Tax=Bacillus sp. V59.32b TaxID=1758642 RepID=UPI000E3C5DF6|nr:SDR family oxidoreductase [Bacillus sp. V59.32b]RFU60159.1 NAD-dependent epimerase/dehydratase family protein [Bacillus sp. V59.32b]